MEVTVLFFARSRELAGISETKVALPADSTSLKFMDLLLKQVSLGVTWALEPRSFDI